MKRAILAMAFLTVASCDRPAPDPAKSVAPSLAPEKMKERKSSCQESLHVGEQAGLVSPDGPLRINVDESAWASLTWEQKEIMLDCLAVIDADGGDPGDRIVSAYGIHTGKRLAGGSPGAGTLAPD